MTSEAVLKYASTLYSCKIENVTGSKGNNYIVWSQARKLNETTVKYKEQQMNQSQLHNNRPPTPNTENAMRNMTLKC